MRATKEIKINGTNVNLTERNARDVLDLSEYANKKELDAGLSLLIAAQAVSDSICCGLNGFKKPLRRRYTARRLVDCLTEKQIYDLFSDLLELEGKIDKKKVAQESPLEEVSQDALFVTSSESTNQKNSGSENTENS